MKQILDLVKEELKNKLNLKDIEDYTEISIDNAVDILEAEGLPVYTEFKSNLTTPWSIAKYIKLSLDEQDLIKKVTEDFISFLPQNIDYIFLKKLSCTVQLSKTFIEGEKKQALTLKYFLDEDEKIQYKILSTSTWGWDITKAQLKALLSNTGFISEKLSDTSVVQKTKWYNRIFKRG